METLIEETAIVKVDERDAAFRPPAIVNLPVIMPERTQQTVEQLDVLPMLAKGILRINLPESPPVVFQPEPAKSTKLPTLLKSIVHRRREEAFD